jgi:hypothetical protein
MRAAPALLASASLLAGCQFNWSLASRADAVVLSDVSLHESDAGESAVYSLVDHGDEVAGQVSLDLCRADFPSEALRQARHQVQVADAGAGMWVSSEAIAYGAPREAERAMSELAAAAANCPGPGAGPGSSKDVATAGGADLVHPAADDQGLSWSFQQPPDADWPSTPGVARQAYAFVISDLLGDSASYVTTYLRRGRILVAIYVTPPDSSATVLVNAPSQERMVTVMSARLAALPAADVS